MGEYEPEDSRNVTLKPGTEAGGLERTGPKEDTVRREAQERKKREADEKKAAEAKAKRDRA